MRRLTIILIALFVSATSFSQVLWFQDMNTAQELAKEEGKLILVDFWATWCGPCKVMDRKLWNTEEFRPISDVIVPLKIDIDLNTTLAKQYGVRSIPRVILMNVNGDIIWDETGFSSAETYLKVLEKVPQDVKLLNAQAQTLLNDKKSNEAIQGVAMAYQELGKTNDSYYLKSAFLQLSDKYFKKVKNDEVAEQLSELNTILNIAYRGKTKSAMKKISKLDEKYDVPKLAELYHFIQAYCFKENGDNENFLINKKLLKDQKYISQLES